MHTHKQNTEVYVKSKIGTNTPKQAMGALYLSKGMLCSQGIFVCTQAGVGKTECT